MKNSIHISALLEQPVLLQEMVERLATCRSDIGYCNEIMPDGWQAIETSSTEAYVNGSVEIWINELEGNRLPFTTSFFFTCAHTKNDGYKLKWISSLS